MLPAQHRLCRSEDFRAATRGRAVVRRGSPLLVVHARTIPRDTDVAPVARVGFVVSKAVGNSVVRSRTKRRLRHLVRDRLAALPAGTDVVIRANPACATAASTDLAADLDRLLARVVDGLVKRQRQSTRGEAP